MRLEAYARNFSHPTNSSDTNQKQICETETNYRKRLEHLIDKAKGIILEAEMSILTPQRRLC